MNSKYVIMLILWTFIGCERSVDVKLGSGYKLITSASFRDLIIVKDDGIGVLSGHIIDCMFDSTFIIASQKPRDSIRECSGKIPDMILKGCDEAFEKSTYRQYWIINKKIGNVYGPYKKEEYLKKLQELNIPSTIKLKE